MFFRGTLDAIGRIARLSLRDRDKVADFVRPWRTGTKHLRLKLNELAYTEVMSHQADTFVFMSGRYRPP